MPKIAQFSFFSLPFLMSFSFSGSMSCFQREACEIPAQEVGGRYPRRLSSFSEEVSEWVVPTKASRFGRKLGLKQVHCLEFGHTKAPALMVRTVHTPQNWHVSGKSSRAEAQRRKSTMVDISG